MTQGFPISGGSTNLVIIEILLPSSVFKDGVSFSDWMGNVPGTWANANETKINMEKIAICFVLTIESLF
ncbi:hypothetical protein EBX93_10190 [bacterium]|nr:hypothetical protein [bacterium]